MSSKRGEDDSNDDSGAGNREAKKKRTSNATCDSTAVYRKILDALERQNAVLETQNNLLGSIDARLGCFLEQTQLQGGRQHRLHYRNSATTMTVPGTWKFAANESYQKVYGRAAETVYGSIESEHSVLRESGCSGRSVLVLQHNGMRPNWSDSKNRHLLPQLTFESDKKVQTRSGKYSLKIKFEKCEDRGASTDAGIII